MNVDRKLRQLAGMTRAELEQHAVNQTTEIVRLLDRTAELRTGLYRRRAEVADLRIQLALPVDAECLDALANAQAAQDETS